jgi:hypothetical protein
MGRGEDKITVEKARHFGQHLLREFAQGDHMRLAVLSTLGGYDPFVAIDLASAHFCQLCAARSSSEKQWDIVAEWVGIIAARTEQRLQFIVV